MIRSIGACFGLLAILFGAAAGNVARGVPLDADGNFSMAFFTDFNVRGYVGLLDWYTVSVAVFALVSLWTGAAYGITHVDTAILQGFEKIRTPLLTRGARED